jgi:hypothetical protein
MALARPFYSIPPLPPILRVRNGAQHVNTTLESGTAPPHPPIARSPNSTVLSLVEDLGTIGLVRVPGRSLLPFPVVGIGAEGTAATR